MSLDPSAERDDIRRRYPKAGWRDIAVFVVGAIALVLADRFLWSVPWPFFIGWVLALGGCELTKARLWRNADEYARAGSRA